MNSYVSVVVQEWQRERRKETEELKKRRELEDQEEEDKTESYREISKRLEGFAEEEVKEAKALVASFIRAGEEIEEVRNICSLSLVCIEK